jgi:hypothetical protein
MSAGDIVPISIAPIGIIEKVAHDVQVSPTAQQTAAQQKAVDDLRQEQKQVQKTEKGDTIFKVGDEPEEERKQRRKDAHAKGKEEQAAPEEKPDGPPRPWAGHLLDVKI